MLVDPHAVVKHRENFQLVLVERPLDPSRDQLGLVREVASHAALRLDGFDKGSRVALDAGEIIATHSGKPEANDRPRHASPARAASSEF